MPPAYITTAINYTNGRPHVGHAYEAVAADAIARYHRRAGRDVFFATGTDEHGQKIAERAEKEGVAPMVNCDKYAELFQTLNRRLNISSDRFVRTTEPAHRRTAQALWRRCAADIYLGRYSGWYDVKEETFVSAADAEAAGFKGPAGNALEPKDEPSYFFALSKYHDRLVAHIEATPSFVQPADRRAELLDRLRRERLRDLSISRTTVAWGVPVPDDPAHVMYVWFDALASYATAADAVLGGPREGCWPADLHLIGKDILWFHCVIWPCMLMSAGMALPTMVFAHGFVQDASGRKMSKSEGNVVDPLKMLTKPVATERGEAIAGYPADLLRLFMMRRATFGADLKFSELALKQMHNKELVGGLGNLLHRATSLAHRYSDGVVPDARCVATPPFDLRAVAAETERLYAAFRLNEAAALAFDCVRRLNEWVTEREPWKMREEPARRAGVVRALLEGVYVAAHFLEPFVPGAAATIFDRLGTPPRPIPELDPGFGNVAAGTKVTHGAVLFAKLAM